MTTTTDMLSDRAILDEMETAIRRHIEAALIECSALAQDLRRLDPAEVMTSLRLYVDPAKESTAADAISDGLWSARKKVDEDAVDDARTDEDFENPARPRFRSYVPPIMS